jgi:hypothetical protein
MPSLLGEVLPKAISNSPFATAGDMGTRPITSMAMTRVRNRIFFLGTFELFHANWTLAF